MECFGFELTLEEQISNAEWRVRSDGYTGTISTIRAAGCGYEILLEVRADRNTGLTVPDAVSVSPADGRLEAVLHESPMYQRGTHGEGSLYHPLRFPDMTKERGRPQKRVGASEDTRPYSPQFLSEMARLGVELVPYAEAAGPTDSSHKASVCVVLPREDPMLVCAVFIGEKVIPWLRITEQ